IFKSAISHDFADGINVGTNRVSSWSRALYQQHHQTEIFYRSGCTASYNGRRKKLVTFPSGKRVSRTGPATCPLPDQGYRQKVLLSRSQHALGILGFFG